jgi:hypothetical protein
LQWECYITASANAAATMTEHNSEALARINRTCRPDLIVTRQQLASKDAASDLCEVLSQAFKIINVVKASAINSRLFFMLSKEMCLPTTWLILHNDIHWLSQAEMLTRHLEVKQG